jgi:endonuclease YncB( thermonuclease family)
MSLATLARMFPAARGRCMAAALLLATSAHAEPMRGRVVAIIDGDTIMVLAAQQEVRVRISGIDAPEGRQPFGDRSRQNLAAMALQKEARLECHKKDRYKQSVCKVWVQPSDCPSCGTTLEVGHAQVVAGMAWWHRDYAREQTPEDRGRYESAENEARLRKWGLWKGKDPVPPWQWQDQPPSAKAGQPAQADSVTQPPPPPLSPPKPYCDRKYDKAKNHADIVCGWR